VTIKYVPQQLLFSGFGGRKGTSSMGKISTVGILRLRATSAVARGKSVRRSAQDDDFVGVLTKNIQNKLALMGRGPGYPHLFAKPAGSHAYSLAPEERPCTGSIQATLRQSFLSCSRDCGNVPFDQRLFRRPVLARLSRLQLAHVTVAQ